MKKKDWILIAIAAVLNVGSILLSTLCGGVWIWIACLFTVFVTIMTAQLSKITIEGNDTE